MSNNNNAVKIDLEAIKASARTTGINAAVKYLADTPTADSFGQNEAAKSIIRMLIAEGYISAEVFEDKATAEAPKDEAGEPMFDGHIQAEKVRLFAMIHPLTNAAAMNRTMKDKGHLNSKLASDEYGF